MLFRHDEQPRCQWFDDGPDRCAHFVELSAACRGCRRSASSWLPRTRRTSPRSDTIVTDAEILPGIVSLDGDGTVRSAVAVEPDCRWCRVGAVSVPELLVRALPVPATGAADARRPFLLLPGLLYGLPLTSTLNFHIRWRIRFKDLP